MIKRFIYRLLPTPVRIQEIPTYFTNLYLDIADLLLGRREDDEPPRRLNISGEGSFRTLGDHNLLLCREYGGLTVEDHVFDLGCGIGRTALAMENFLEPPSSYTGLDIIPFAVRWCERHIARKHENFRFVHADVFNLMYNPRGKLNPDLFSFPFPQGSFTFCLGMSLFTHLLPTAIEQYLREVARVLKDGASFTSTWFLLCPETRAAMRSTGAQSPFPYVFSRHSQRSLHAPEQAVAFDLEYIRELYNRAGLEIQAIHLGGWSGYNASINSGQDLIVANRVPDKLG